MRHHLRLALLAVFLVPFAARAEDGVEERWDRMHMAGAYAGYVRTVVKRTAGDKPQVECTVESRVSMKRMGQGTEVESTTRSWEAPDGALLRIETTQKMSAQETRTVCVFSGGKVSMETTVMGKTHTVEKDVPAGLVGPVRAGELGVPLAGTTGKTAECLMFLLEFQSAVQCTSASKGEEQVKMLDGASVPLTRVETSMTLSTAKKPLPMTTVSWLDAKGDPVRTEVKVSGIVIETFRVADEAAAKAEGETKGPAKDLFAETLIREDGLLPVARLATEATIEVKPREKGVTLPEFGDAGHEVTPRDDGSLTIRATRRVPAAGKEGTRPLAPVPADLADCMGSSSMVQADAAEIAAVVKEVVGAETNAWKAAQALERWVFESVTKKNMNVAFASALEVCKSREGDCTEHAVLLAALCRAAGIPARVVMGVEYLYGIWGGHAWDEVWIDGAWYPLDATNGFGFVDPLHLPMARLTMKEGAGAEFVELLGGLGNIDVDVVEVVRDGRRIAVDDPALVTTKDGVHTDRVLGIAYTAPAGFEFDPPRSAPGIRMKTMELEAKTADGKKAEIEIQMLDAAPRHDWANLFAQFGVDPSSAKPFKVDGRDARRIERARGDRREVRVVAEADGAVWMFRLDRAEGAAEVAAFDALLASVDFDVK